MLVPEPVILVLVATSNDSKTESSEALYITMVPVSESISSEKFNTKFPLVANVVEL